MSILRKVSVALSNLRNGHVTLSNLRNCHVPCHYLLKAMSHVTKPQKGPRVDFKGQGPYMYIYILVLFARTGLKPPLSMFFFHGYAVIIYHCEYTAKRGLL